jgi:hypothetical protein
MPTSGNEMYCPRCDRIYDGGSRSATLEIVKKHVAEQHPDHDPEWWDTYPTAYQD